MGILFTCFPFPPIRRQPVNNTTPKVHVCLLDIFVLRFSEVRGGSSGSLCWNALMRESYGGSKRTHMLELSSPERFQCKNLRICADLHCLELQIANHKTPELRSEPPAEVQRMTGIAMSSIARASIGHCKSVCSLFLSITATFSEIPEPQLHTQITSLFFESCSCILTQISRKLGKCKCIKNNFPELATDIARRTYR